MARTAPPPEPVTDPTAARAELPPEIVAQSLGEYVRAWTLRVRSGDTGVLPVIVGLVVIMGVFEVISPDHVFLSAGNLVNLFQQSAVIMVLAIAESFALLLGEIDLSVGFVGAVGGVVAVQLVQPVTTNWPWWAAIIGGLLVCALIGAFQGWLIGYVRLPSFIVTLGGYIWNNGLMLVLLLLGPFSGYPSLAGRGDNLKVLYDLMWGDIPPTWSWVGMAVIVAVLGLLVWRRDWRRRRSGLVAPPLSLTVIKIGVYAAVGVVVVAICNVNRAALGIVVGVPWVIPIVFAVLAAATLLLERMRYGRYVYAIGGNPEAARRAGINLARIRNVAFAICALCGGIGGMLYASYLGGMSNNVNGGPLVLYAVAAAVIGGTSLFGGRGRAMNGVLGGIVIGAIYNGMYLMGMDVQWQYIVTGFVLLAALTVDAVSRRGSASGSVAHV